MWKLTSHRNLASVSHNLTWRASVGSLGRISIEKLLRCYAPRTPHSAHWCDFNKSTALWKAKHWRQHNDVFSVLCVGASWLLTVNSDCTKNWHTEIRIDELIRNQAWKRPDEAICGLWIRQEQMSSESVNPHTEIFWDWEFAFWDSCCVGVQAEFTRNDVCEFQTLCSCFCDWRY